jgi:hypothetical protein
MCRLLKNAATRFARFYDNASTEQIILPYEFKSHRVEKSCEIQDTAVCVIELNIPHKVRYTFLSKSLSDMLVLKTSIVHSQMAFIKSLL